MPYPQCEIPLQKIPCGRTSVINLGGFKAQSSATRGFGIIFAYDATLKWKTIFGYMKQYQKENDKTEWTNMICILNQGIILQTDDDKAVFSSNEIEESRNNNLMGMPSTSGNLLNLYLILMDLLNNANLPVMNVRDYVFINNPVEDKSYYFTYGELGELGKCKKHGSYLKKISNSSIQKIVSECKNEKSINWLKAIDIAYGDALDEERYAKQPRNVKIYNPEKLELSQILIDEEGLYQGLLFEDIIIDGVNYWVPYYYALKEKLIKYCPKCEEEKGKE
ncbi:hypothetical protein [Clostridium sp. DJ247]|uniref:hypothetical protein n=1 Tax=Clostridium sp. DJ247 TaxID=2726188 RepID=UPI001628F12C|nr:hypothetical protein [Clostridium sp. DJ247]MBC2580853.1 hypothetical protein [Clostridium sp. DJ247]